MAFRFEHLAIWKDGIAYANEIYKLTKLFPREELFSFSDQLKRAASSIPTNIAEGSGSSSKKDFSHYLAISIKSTYETVSLLHLALQQGYVSLQTRDKLYLKAELLVKKIQAFKNTLKSP